MWEGSSLPCRGRLARTFLRKERGRAPSTLRKMPFDASNTIREFLDATAAKQPAPGGGSVTALAGALSAAIGEMVLSYSVGKKDLAQHESTLRDALAELNRARSLMLELMIEDQAAFEALSAARKNAKGLGDKDAAFAIALLACIRIPQVIAATGLAMLGVCDRLARIANKHLLSDLAVCAELAMATVRCASYNVRVNLPDVSDTEERDGFDASAVESVARGSEIVRQVIPAIWKRLTDKT